jgi:hypothetical protein
MGILKEWKINRRLTKEIEECKAKIEDLENSLQVLQRNVNAGKLEDNLINDIKAREKEYKVLKREFDNLKEWTYRLLELSKVESADLAYVKYRYFNLIKDNRVTEMNLVGADRSYAFAIQRFEQIREENIELKKKLAKYEKQD